MCQRKGINLADGFLNLCERWREIVKNGEETSMILRTLYDDSLAQASYLIGCSDTGEALVIDPNRHIDHYIQLAQSKNLRITAVTETHIHADFVSGARVANYSSGQFVVSHAGLVKDGC